MKTILLIVFIAIITRTLMGERDKIKKPIQNKFEKLTCDVKYPHIKYFQFSYNEKKWISVISEGYLLQNADRISQLIFYTFLYRTGITFFKKETDIFDSPGPFSTHTHHSEGYIALFKDSFKIPLNKPWIIKEDARFIFHAEKFLRRFLTCILGNLDDSFFMEDCFYQIALRHKLYIFDESIIDDAIEDLGSAVWYFVRLNCPDTSEVLSYESFHFYLMSQALNRNQDILHVCSFAWMKVRILMLRAFVFAFKEQNYRAQCYGTSYSSDGKSVWELEMVDKVYRKIWDYDEYRVCNSSKIGNFETNKTYWTNGTDKIDGISDTQKPECITKYKFRKYVD